MEVARLWNVLHYTGHAIVRRADANGLIQWIFVMEEGAGTTPRNDGSGRLDQRSGGVTGDHWKREHVEYAGVGIRNLLVDKPLIAVLDRRARRRTPESGCRDNGRKRLDHAFCKGRRRDGNLDILIDESTLDSYAKDPVRILVLTIVNEFVPYERPDQERRCDAYRESDHVDRSEGEMPAQMTAGDVDIVSQHVFSGEVHNL